MDESRNESQPEVPVRTVAGIERRRMRRVKLAQPARVRPADPRYEEEVQATQNFSRNGLYFVTRMQHYYIDMHLEVVFPYRTGEPFVGSKVARIVRLERRADNHWGVAVEFLLN